MPFGFHFKTRVLLLVPAGYLCNKKV